MFKRWEWKVLLVIVLAGLAVRCIYLMEIVESPDFRFPFVDASYHDYWARLIVDGDSAALPEDADGLDPRIGDHAYVRPPGYPFFLAAIYALTDSSPLAVRIVQMLMGVVNALLAYGLCRSLFGRGAGLITAAGMSLYWIFIYYEGKLHAPVLLIFGCLCLLHLCRLLIRKPTFLRASVAGLLLGLCALVRPNFLLFAPVLLAWLFRTFRKGIPDARFSSAAIGVVAGLSIAILPVTIRNYVKADDVVLISANAGVNLYIGNNPEAEGFFMQGIPYLKRFGNCFDYPAVVKNIEQQTGREMKYSQVSRFFSEKAFAFIKENPGKSFRLVDKKLMLFWGPGEIKHNNEVTQDRAFSGTLSRIPGNFAAVLAAALVGFILIVMHLSGRLRIPGAPEITGRSGKDGRSEKDGKELRAMFALLVLFAITYCASFLPFFITALYRVPVIPLLVIFGSVGVWCAVHSLWSRRLLPFGITTAALLGIFFALNLSGDASENDPRSTARWHFARGVAYSADDRFDSAEAEYRKALAADPTHINSMCNLAKLIGDSGKVEEAARLFRTALAARPDFEEAHCGLAHLLANNDDFEQAIAHYEEAIRIRPVYIEARINLANALFRIRRFEEATTQYKEVLRLDPNHARAHCNLGLTLARGKRFDEAIEHYEAALRIDPNYATAYVNLGIAQSMSGRIEEAIENLEKALKIDPGDEATRRRLMELKQPD